MAIKSSSAVSAAASVSVSAAERALASHMEGGPGATCVFPWRKGDVAKIPGRPEMKPSADQLVHRPRSEKSTSTVDDLGMKSKKNGRKTEEF
mmetsp:Transcript_77714/g.155635  ORF Transcript_77714/g.155635 Transcript_77714/m.155635 type:complete len:92 (-) Transcript_77714:79-354(-)